MPEESPKVLEQPFARVPKIRHPFSLTSRQPQRPQNISKKFSIISGAPTWRIYKVHRQALPGLQNRKRVHGEFCSESCGGFPRCIFGGSCGASSMNPNESCDTPFSRIFQRGLPRLPLPPRSPKNVPRKATTRQDAPK